MNDLVFLSSENVYAGITHRSINRTIIRTQARISRFGKVRFKITRLDNGQNAKVYLLNEEQATAPMSRFRTNKCE